jgi:hypothetical protein
MDDFRTLAELMRWPLMGFALLMPFVAKRRLAGFDSPNLWGVTAFLEWLTALDLLVIATGERGMDRGFTIFASVVWFLLGCWSYRTWQKDDDGKPPRKRIRSWIKARLPQARQTVPVKG